MEGMREAQLAKISPCRKNQAATASRCVRGVACPAIAIVLMNDPDENDAHLNGTLGRATSAHRIQRQPKSTATPEKRLVMSELQTFAGQIIFQS